MILERADNASRVGWQDHYKTLAFKTLAFWQLVIEQYNARYIIKVDDDNYVRLDRLAIAVRQWEDIGAGGAPSCMWPASNSLSEAGLQCQCAIPPRSPCSGMERVSTDGHLKTQPAPG